MNKFAQAWNYWKLKHERREYLDKWLFKAVLYKDPRSGSKHLAGVVIAFLHAYKTPHKDLVKLVYSSESLLGKRALSFPRMIIERGNKKGHFVVAEPNWKFLIKI